MDCSWPIGNASVKLQEKVIHVWCASLELSTDQLAILERTLSADEVERANRYCFLQHRRRYVAGRGILRRLVSRYVGKAPIDLIFSYSEYDKPSIPNSSLQFNLSHCEEVALYAFCSSADIGIDLEQIRTLNDAERIAERFFAPTEFARFMALPIEERNEAFFACWTRKEAFIKAVGEGLSYPLADFDVSFSDGDRPKINTIRNSAKEAAEWSLFSLAPVPGYAAALAVKGKDWQLSCRQI